MPTYAVTYHYTATTEHLAEVRPIHREWLAARLAEGSLLASGPMVYTPTSLLIWKANSVQEILIAAKEGEEEFVEEGKAE